MKTIEIPYSPRRWARALHASYLRWAVLVLHRRAGKTTAVLNHHQRAATDHSWERARLKTLLPDAEDGQIETLMRKRVYWHVMPTFRQGKVTGAWEMLKEISRPIPGIKVNESDMSVRYPDSGYGRSLIQIIGADKPDSLRGPGLSGLSLDEYSQIPANAFGEVLSKALADHLGYAIFAGTIKGFDQLQQTYEAVKTDPSWLSVWRTVDDSLRDEAGATIEALKRAMEDDRKLVLGGQMTQAEYDQEWYLSAEAAIRGAIYGKEMDVAKRDGRITRVPLEPALPVDTDWDLGVGDATAIWFSQRLRTGEVRFVDYYEATGEGMPHYARVLQERGYVYGQHWGPHDIAVRELGTGKTRIETASQLGLRFQTCPNIGLEEGISAARLLLPRCWFDETKCKAGLEALRHYRRSFNERLQEFQATPVHNWAEHGASAFRYRAVRDRAPRETRPQSQGPRMPTGPMSWAG